VEPSKELHPQVAIDDLYQLFPPLYYSIVQLLKLMYINVQ
jgi:hypothetical protein